MQELKKTIDFTYRESNAIRRMFDDMKGIAPLTTVPLFSCSIKEREFYQKLAIYDQYEDANTIGVDLQALKEVASYHSVSATLFNLYASEEAKKDVILAQQIVTIAGENLAIFDFDAEVKQNNLVTFLAVAHDHSTTGVAFNELSSEDQKKTNLAGMWLRHLYQQYQQIGVEPTNEIIRKVFLDTENSVVRIEDREVVASWLQDEKFCEDLLFLDEKFQTVLDFEKTPTTMIVHPDTKKKIYQKQKRA